MILESNRCPHDQLPALLDETLSTEQAAELTNHLETCKSCQKQLEGFAAEPGLWKETRLVLSDPALRTILKQAGSPRLPASGSQKAARDKQCLASLVPNLEPSPSGDALGQLDGYEIFEVIGFGGMGVVLRAFEPALARPVAIKVLHPHLATHVAARRRFAREARAAAAVNHPSVVPIHAVNAESNPPYIVMGFVPGGSLQDRIDREGPLAISDVLRIGCQVADALAAAHAQGLVHRDVKPGNILLDHGQDRVLLSDFGLAQALDDASLTASGMIAGTPQYMSPEQARGESVDVRSDIFSLGGVLYAMVSGRPPFRGNSTLAILNKIGRESVKPVCEVMPEVPEWFSCLVGMLMSNDLQQRPASASDVAQLMRDSLAHLRSPSTTPLPGVLAVQHLKLSEPCKPSKPVAKVTRGAVNRKILMWLLPLCTLMVFVFAWLWRFYTSEALLQSQTEPTHSVQVMESSKDNVYWNDGLDDDFRDVELLLDALKR